MSAGAPRPHRSRLRKILKYASPVLRFSAAASDALPPLKGAIGGALWIVDAVQDFEDNQEDWRTLASHVQDVVKALHGEGQESLFEEREAQLNHVLLEIRAEIEAIRTQSSRKQWLAFLKDRSRINDYKSRVDRAVTVFSTETAVAIHRSAVATHRTAKATHRSAVATRRTATAALRIAKATRRELAELRTFQADAIDKLMSLERGTTEQTHETWSIQWFIREVKPNPTQIVVIVVLFAESGAVDEARGSFKRREIAKIRLRFPFAQGCLLSRC